MSAAMNEPVEAVLRSPLGGLRNGGLGFVGPDVCIDLLLASGRPFAHLPWNAAPATPFADQWLESGFPGWSRSILQQWHEGAFDGLEAVVFSRTDDASQRLYYYTRELQRRSLLGGPRALVQDLALVPRESSFEHSVESIALLSRELHVDEAALLEGARRADALRLKLRQVQAARAGQGVFFERLSRALLFSDPTRWLDALVLPAAKPGKRLLLAGSVPPDERLHAAAESAGASIVAETHALAIGRLGQPWGETESSVTRRIARQLIATATGPRAFVDRARWIVDTAREARADAVILWLTREDEALAWHVPAMRRALDEAGVPALILTAASWRADDGAPERIATFCTGVKS